MTPEEYAAEVLEMLKRVAEGIMHESAVTTKAAQQEVPMTIEAMLGRSERLGYVGGLLFAQTLLSRESQRLLAQVEYDARPVQ